MRLNSGTWEIRSIATSLGFVNSMLLQPHEGSSETLQNDGTDTAPGSIGVVYLEREDL